MNDHRGFARFLLPWDRWLFSFVHAARDSAKAYVARACAVFSYPGRAAGRLFDHHQL